MVNAPPPPPPTAQVRSQTPTRFSCRPHENTQSRLFGIDDSRRKMRTNDTYRSTIFSPVDSNNGIPRTPKRTIAIIDRNPITGVIKEIASKQTNGSNHEKATNG